MYINTDGTGKGWLNAGGSHGLQQLIGEVAKDVMDPRTGKPIFEEARRRAVLGEPEAERKAAEADPSLRIAPLGSGSDFTPFLQHLTLSALNVGFGGESPGGVYHSAYDTIKWYQTYSDTDYSYGRTLSQLTGTLILRLADAPVLPFQFTDTADTLLRYVVELEKLASDKKDSKVDMKPVRDAVEALKAAGQSFREGLRIGRKANSQSLLAKKDLQQLNKLLLTSEQKLGNTEGLPRRDWFKHQIYAPGFYTGYGVKTMPQIREGLEEGRFTEAQGGVRTVSAAVNALAAQVTDAAQGPCKAPSDRRKIRAALEEDRFLREDDILRPSLPSRLSVPVVVAVYWTLLFFAQRSMLFPMPPVAGAPARPVYAGANLAFDLLRPGGGVVPAVAWHVATAGAVVAVHARQRRAD